MSWTFVYLMVFLKLPIVALLLLVWWAIRQDPARDEAEGDDSDDGGTKRPRHPRSPLRPRPRDRGPQHGMPAPAAPRRVRTVVARARSTAHNP